MRQEPVDKYFRMPISEWIAKIPNELDIDAVGLWQIIPVGIDSFGLSNKDLEDFIRRCIVALIGSGAVPVKAGPDISGWVPEMRYQGSPEEIANRVIGDWKADKLVADHDGLWFSRPRKV